VYYSRMGKICLFGNFFYSGRLMITLKNISKKFGTHTALDSVNLTVGSGEIHGLAGANGSGKSTLLNILFGNPMIRNTGGYSGEIFIHGKKADIHSPKSSCEYGIGMIHQEFALIPDMSIYENIAICREKTYPLTEKIFGKSFSLIDRQRTQECADTILKALGINIASNLRVAHLPVNLKQFIAIAGELSKHNLKLLMLDEPTSALNRKDSEILLNTVKTISRKGYSVLYVSHRIEEMMNICDIITVLRDGKTEAVFEKKDFDTDRISTAIVGSTTVKAIRKKTQQTDNILMTFRNFSVYKPHEPISDLNMEIFKGEILGITSLSGHGKSALGYGVMGMYETKGDIMLENEKLDIANPRNTLSKGILFIPEDRREKGLLLSQSVMKNMVFTALQTSDNYYLHRFRLLSSLSLIHNKNCRKYAEDSVKKFDINCRSVNQKAGELSGGNQQKVCIARACAINPKILFISEPTRGVDIGAKEIILETLLDISENFGATVIIASGEIEELKRICDRIAVMYKGKLFAVFSPDQSDKTFFQAMSGIA
jgi:simple sugar transport system ATP-binding protein